MVVADDARVVGHMLALLTGWRGYVFVLVLGAASGWIVQGWRWNADVAGIERDRAQQIAGAQALARATEQARWAAREGVIDDAKKQAAAAAADADTARAAAERLRGQVAVLQRRVRNTAVASRSEATGDLVGVLAKLFGDADDAAGILAKDLDASRTAGMTCEAAYESLRK